MRTIIFAMSCFVAACGLDERVSMSAQDLCTIEDQEAGYCDPFHLRQSVLRIASDLGYDEAAAEGDAGCRDNPNGSRTCWAYLHATSNCIIHVYCVGNAPGADGTYCITEIIGVCS